MVFSVSVTSVAALPMETGAAQSFSSLAEEILRNINNDSQQVFSSSNNMYQPFNVTQSRINGIWRFDWGTLEGDVTGSQELWNIDSTNPSQFRIEMRSHAMGYAMRINNGSGFEYTIISQGTGEAASTPIPFPGDSGRFQRISPTEYRETDPDGGSSILGLYSNDSMLRLTLEIGNVQMILNFNRVSETTVGGGGSGGIVGGGGGGFPGGGGGGSTGGNGNSGDSSGCNIATGLLAMLLALPVIFKKKK